MMMMEEKQESGSSARVNMGVESLSVLAPAKSCIRGAVSRLVGESWMLFSRTIAASVTRPAGPLYRHS